MNNTIELSIIIVSYNTQDLLRNCLKSIYENIRNTSFEIFVVDNASSDGSAEMAATEFKEVRLIENTENVGFAAANNQAITKSKGRFILLLNPDTVVLDESIDKMVCFLEKNDTVGALGCRLIDQNGKMQKSTRDHYPTLFTSLLATWNFALTGGMLWINTQKLLNSPALSRFRLSENSSYESSYQVLRETSVIIGCCLMTKREVIESVGLLDENFFLGGEEVDWCFRIKKAGWKLFFFQEGQIIHYGKASMKQNPIHRFLYHKNTYYYLKKHIGLPSAIIYKMTLPPTMGLGILVHSAWRMSSSGEKAVDLKNNVKSFWRTVLWCFNLYHNSR